MANPQLVNPINHAPFFTYKNEGIEVRVYTAQNIYIGEKYIARNYAYFEKSGSAVLYLSTKISSQNGTFVFTVPQFDKRFVKEWTKEQWVELVYLLHRKDKVEKDLEEIQEALQNMKMFSEIRKNAKQKQKELKQDVKSADRAIEDFLQNIREAGNERIVYKD